MNKLTIYSRDRRTSSTPSEMILWSKLRNRQFLGFKFRRQCPIGDRYIVDFICKEKNLVIEINGSSHDENKFSHDIRRQKYLEEEFKHKIFLCKKEINESKYWLELLISDYPTNELKDLLNEVEELRLIFNKISNKLRSSERQ